MKLYDSGVYLVNGHDIVEEGSMNQPVSREEAARNTMAYGILEAHNTSGNMEKLQIKFDKLTSHDMLVLFKQHVHQDSRNSRFLMY